MNRKVDVEEKVATSLYSAHYIIKAITEFYEEALPQTDFKPSQRWSNIRLFLLFIACASGLYAQFRTVFPNDYWIMASCVVGYFLFSGIVATLDYFIIKGSTVVIPDKAGEVFVGLEMKRGQSHATMTLRRKWKAGKEYKVDISKLFDEEGVLLQTPALAVLMDNLAAFGVSVKSKKTN